MNHSFSFGKVAILIIVILFHFPLNNLFSQTCGFGCLGLSGVYVGYNFQRYNAVGLNEFINFNMNPNLKQDNNIDFSRSKGFKVGANIFRAKFEEYFLTAKGFFQFLKDEKSSEGNTQTGLIKEYYELETNYWGIGVDFGIPVFNIVDWKIVEGGITFVNTEYTKKIESNGKQLDKFKYESSKVDIGYFFGTGLIIHVIEDYISLEGTAAYNIIKVDKLQDDKEIIIPGNLIDKKLIENGGFSATIQLNIGVPI